MTGLLKTSLAQTGIIGKIESRQMASAMRQNHDFCNGSFSTNSGEVARWLMSAFRRKRLAANYLAFVQLASIRLWLCLNESTP
jgi:hypothetical protein